MSGIRVGLSRRKCVLALTATLVFVTPLLAQEQANIRSVTRYRLKPDRAGEFRSVIKELNAVLKKAGHNHAATWWQAQSGPRQLVLITNHAKWAELGVMPAAFKEAAAEIAPLIARLTLCSDSVERTIDEILRDHSVVTNPDEIPSMVRVLRLLVKPDRIDDYLAVHKAEIIPAVKKAGRTVLFSRTRYGGPAYEFRSATVLKGWADLDGPGPLVSAMGGEAAYQKYLAKIRPMMVEAEYNIYVYQPDLSFIPAK